MFATRTIEELMDDHGKRKKQKNIEKKAGLDGSPARRAEKLAARVMVRKAPHQGRSKVMVEAILEAAAEIFAELVGIGMGSDQTNGLKFWLIFARKRPF